MRLTQSSSSPASSKPPFARGVRWDLSDLYPSAASPRLWEDLEAAAACARDFEKRYKPFFQEPTLSASLPLADLLKDYKHILTVITKPVVYAQLLFAEKTNVPAIGALLQKIQALTTDIRSHLLFFEVSWNKLDAETARLLAESPAVAPDRHYLEHLRVYAPYTLSEPEEKIMNLKALTSGSAFARLFDEVVNNIPFWMRRRGRREKLSEAHVLAQLHSPLRAERKAASMSLAEGLKANGRLLTYVYNMVLADHRTILKIRRYTHPMDPMNLSNETDLKSVMSLVDAVKQAYPLAARFYQLKKKALRLERLTDYDRYAPLEARSKSVPFERCREIVVEGYRAFSPQAGAIAEQFFSKRWIDAEVREGKRGGAFSCMTTPDLHPYILVNYTGTLRDVLTVAHELGHGIHQTLSGRRVGVLEADAPLTLAETASVFGEMLIFERLLAEEKDPGRRLALLCGKIDDQIATVFRQIALTDFELRVHEAGARDGELAFEIFGQHWMEANRELYGSSVELTDAYRCAWSYIPHFIHCPFYCYAYAFAQLFVLALYQQYRSGKPGFVESYLEMLSLGGSRKPQEIAQLVGLDIQREDFWRTGLSLLEELIAQAERSAEEVGLVNSRGARSSSAPSRSRSA